jgi:diacylglycerol kinase
MKSNDLNQKKKKFSWAKRMHSFSYAFNGFKILFREEHNSWIHIAAALAVNVLGLWLQLTAIEWIVIWLCIGLVFLTELINTALENLCDHISPEKNEAIGKVKDLAAAAVLVTAMTSVIVASFVFFSRIPVANHFP